MGLADTQDDGRYAFDYFHSVLDIGDAFDAQPFVSAGVGPFLGPGLRETRRGRSIMT